MKLETLNLETSTKCLEEWKVCEVLFHRFENVFLIVICPPVLLPMSVPWLMPQEAVKFHPFSRLGW